MSKRNPADTPRDERDLEDLLLRSLASLRESPLQRKKFPALDRMLSRIKAREQRLARRDPARWLTWLRPLFGPLTAGAAGFAGAALALAILPGPTPPTPNDAVAAGQTLRNETRDSVDQSVQHLENAVHGLEKFQPLLESRIEWVEDALQRLHRNAYVSVERGDDTRRRRQSTQPRKGDGV